MDSNTDNTNKSSNSTKKRNIYIVISLAFILFCEFVLLAIITTPNVTKSRTSTKRAACFSNVRILQAAVEMYNNDKTDFMISLDINTLINEKYIKNAPTKPESDCEYLLENGIVYCKYHGFYDEKREKELKAKEKSKITRSKTESFFLFILICSIPSLIYLFFTLISGNESYICFTILFILIVFIIGCFPQISLLLITFQ